MSKTVQPGETHYAKSGDVSIAYQVAGEGPLDLVLVPGWVSHVEQAWEETYFSRFLKRLASFTRLIILDRRGTGLSDRVTTMPTLEERMDDVRAVMDAAGSARAALFGVSEGGPMCTLFAATYPEKTHALILCATFARGIWAEDYTFGLRPDILAESLNLFEKAWGTGVTAKLFAPNFAKDRQFVEACARLERHAVSPGNMRTLVSMLYETDVRHVLPHVHVPTLVIHRTGDKMTPVEGGRYLAEHIPDARYVEFPGEDHFPFVGDSDAILDEVARFLTGKRPREVPDRQLLTVLFVDIAGSTEKVVELGDARWAELLGRFQRAVRDELHMFRGVERDTAGDGFFATFDGPARAIQCAHGIRDAANDLGLDVRAGLHTGECQAGDGKVTGVAVHAGARIASLAAANEVLLSSTVKDLVAGAGLLFEDRGSHALKGLEGQWTLFASKA